jgi:prepilin-type N-terminal cleavage/methylation domain-containing protein
LVSERFRWLNGRGFGLAEMLVVVAVIGITTAVAMPSLLSYWRSAVLTSGAQELQSLLGSARQLAIRQNTTVCVERSGSRIRYLVGSCGGTAWVGAGTDASGWMRLSNSVEITNATASVAFSYLGAANPGGTYTVRNPVHTAQTLDVTVTVSGRVRID